MRKFIKTIGAAACALVVFGLLPAPSWGAPELTHPTGTRLPVGTLLKGTNVGEFKITEPAFVTTFSCANTTFTGELKKNNGTEVEATISEFKFSGTAEEHHVGGTPWCTTSPGTTYGVLPAPQVPWCLRSTATMAADEFQMRGGACSEPSKELRFTLWVPGECVYGRTEALKGVLTTDTGASPTDGMLHMVSQAWLRKSGSGLFCPNEYKWDITFTLETDKTIAEPLYFS
jgi:hypothetical protein